MDLILDKIHRIESRHFGLKTLIILASVLWMVADVIMRGELETSVAGFQQCKMGDWLTFMGLGLITFALSIYTMQYLINFTKMKRKGAYPYEINDVQWNSTNAIRFLIIGYCWGLVEGAIGISEGTIFIPVLIELDIHPLVASITGLYFSIIFSAGFTAIHAVEGNYNDLYMVFLGIITVIATIVGFIISRYIQKKTRRYAIMIFIMCVNFIFVAITVPYVFLNRKFGTDTHRQDIKTVGSYWYS